MLLEAKTNNDPGEIDKLKSDSEDLISKVVENSDLNDTVVFGNSLYGGQIYTSDDEALSQENAIKNGLPIFDTKECEAILKAKYNLTGSVIYVTSSTDSLLNTNNLDSYKILAYDSVSKQKLDLEYCDTATQQVHIPMTAEVNLTLYNKMKEEGIDIFDPNDPIFNDRCASYVDETTGKDTSLNWRRENLFQKQVPMCVGFNCTYVGINEFDYLTCNCTGFGSKSELVNQVLDSAIKTLSNFNIGIVRCYAQILKVYKQIT
jgi:hypothetical protein